MFENTMTVNWNYFRNLEPESGYLFLEILLLQSWLQWNVNRRLDKNCHGRVLIQFYKPPTSEEEEG